MKSQTSPAPKKGLRSVSARLATSIHKPIELTFNACGSYADPFNQIVVDVVFTDPAGEERRVPGFWAGGTVWKVRYSSALAGRHTYRSVCSASEDTGLHGRTSVVEISPNRSKNPLFRHGPVQVAANRRHFEHADGTPFFWLGDTWWMGLCHRLPWPQGFQQLTADRVAKGYNVVQIIAGLYPDMHAFDPRGANEAGFPWEENYAHIRPEYFDAADKKLAHLIAQGITPCLVGAWGYFLSWMSADQLKAQWRYLIARYAAWPVLWCIAGEANLPWYLAKNFPEDDRSMVKGWTEIMRYVRATDPFRRPMTIHPTAINRYTSRNATDDESLLDFDLMQCYHAQNEAVTITVGAVRETYAATPRMPVLNGEPCYEMLGGTITDPWPRRSFWSCVLNGAAGHTYGANGIWQCNQPGIPHGASPHGGNYGNTPWPEAMHYTGSTHCAIGKKLITRFDWTKFEPHPEWASYVGNVWLPLDDAKWIWSSTEQPAKDAPAQRRYFRKTFTLRKGAKIIAARLRFAGTTHVEAQLNGASAGVGWEWKTGPQFNDRAHLLRPGRNVLSIWCEHRPATGDGPGLLACLEIRYASGRVARIITDDSWKSWPAKIGGWDSLDCDDRGWTPATVVGQSRDKRWEKIASPDMDLHGPQCAGIPGKVRLIYVPHAEPVIVHHLPPESSFGVVQVDPKTGDECILGAGVASRTGTWKAEPPPGGDHDWVIILQGAD